MSGNTQWEKQREKALERDEYECQRCGESGEDIEFHVHHKTRRADGGSDALENLETLCADCHFEHHAELRSRLPSWGEDYIEYEAEDILDIVRSVELPTTGDVAEEMECTRQNALYRLNNLEDDGKVVSKKVGRYNVWQIP